MTETIEKQINKELERLDILDYGGTVMTRYEAKITGDGVEEVNITGMDRHTVLSQSGLFFSQYAQDFNETIELKVTTK